MARYYGLGNDEPTENSEKLVADALRHLPDDWVILHHVSWQSKRGGREGDGEADFIVLHPLKGVLVIEVKGGGIQIDAGRWVTTDRHGARHQIKNPYEQAVASKHALIGWLNNYGLGQRVRVGHAVAFPHMMNLPVIGPAAVPEISLIKPSLVDINGAINRCFDHWQLNANLSEDEVEKVVTLLAPTVSLAPSLAGQSLDAEAKILTFTAEQIEVFAGLRANRGGLILGRAGTGKTILAIARAQQLARDGFNTLLVCYNELLGDELSARTETPPHLMACTFHSLCLREARRAKLPIPSKKLPGWWEVEAPNLLREASALNGTKYDAIVVDEGQDFSPDWLDSLRGLLSAREDGPFFIFADPLQDFWKRDWSQGAQYSFAWELTQNLRNTQPIAAQVAAAVNMSCRDSGVLGPDPIWQLSAKEPAEQDVLAAVEHLLADGLEPTGLVVLCESPVLVSRLRERTIGPYSFGRWGGRGIVVETITRFKGLESQAVVLALSSGNGDDSPIMPYVGMSRARSILLVIGTEVDRQRINWTTKQQ